MTLASELCLEGPGLGLESWTDNFCAITLMQGNKLTVKATAPFRWLQHVHGTVCHQRLGPAPHF